MTKDGESRVKLGHEILALSLVRRLEKHYRQGSASGVENSLVVGIFGEWGSGKSTLLNEVGEQFRLQALAFNLEQRLTIPVRFNPWRYEKEAHLIVPLLKVTQATVEKWKRFLPDSDDAEVNSKKSRVLNALKKAGRMFAISAVSMASVFKLKVGVPGFVGIELSGKDGIEQAKALLKDSEPIEDVKAIQALESHYYEFEASLEEITRPRHMDGDKLAEGLNLLFLIDDLDRCLPEKAVEMLESIKLFLDVPGCAFVVALDDEVVERGIQHRYRDYIFEHKRNGGNANQQESDHAPPITGAEYLEKIIQLPFRLPLPTKPQLKSLLKSRYPELFADIQIKAGQNALARVELKDQATEAIGEALEIRENPLLGFLVDVVPAVPRKLIRSVELIELTQSLAKERGLNGLNDLALARYILLQLFAPQLYRYARNHYKRIFQKLKEWKDEFPDDWRRDDFSDELRKLLFSPGDECRLKVEAGRINNADRSNYERNERKILKMLLEVRSSRAGFDVARLLNNIEGYEDTLNSDKYFSLVDEVLDSTTSAGAHIERRLVAESESQHYQESFSGLIDIDDPEFIDQLFGRQESSWRSALSRDDLLGKQLGAKTHGIILQRLKGEYESFALNIEWLTALSDYLSLDQLKQIYRETRLLEKLQNKGNE